jgi:4-hydroxybenzoyl-CoA thioesterase
MRYHSPLVVRFGDIDHAGVVYNPRFFNYLHVAFEGFLEEAIGQPLHEIIDRRKIGFPIVHAEADFMKVLRYGDRGRIEVYTPRLGRSSLTFGFEVVRAADEALCARARVTHATIDRSVFRAIECPEDLRERFARYLEPGAREPVT